MIDSKINSDHMKIFVIIPCFNEQESLRLFYQQTTAVLQGAQQQQQQQVAAAMPLTYTLFFVDDGSTDATLALLRELATADPHVAYASFSRNFGKEAAIYAGFQQMDSDSDYIAVMDADLQDPPALLPQMLALLQTGNYDNVATYRTSRTHEPPVRSWFAQRFYSLINKMADEIQLVPGARDFRMMTRPMAEAIIAMSERNRFSKGLYAWVGFRTYYLAYENVARVAGTTKWSFWKLLKYAMDGIISYSHQPLNLALWGGLFFMTLPIILLAGCSLNGIFDQSGGGGGATPPGAR